MRKSLLVLPLLATLFACGDDDAPTSTPLTTAEVAPVLETYAAMLHAAYDDSVVHATSLHTALEPLTTGTATAASLDASRAAWTEARLPYMETEVARFYGGPIDDDETGLEGQINSWPMDEAFVD